MYIDAANSKTISLSTANAISRPLMRRCIVAGWLLLFCLVAAVVLILQLISREPRLKVRHTNQSALRLIARHGGVVCVVYNRKPDFKHFVYATYMLTQCVQRTERTNKISTKTTRRSDRMNKPRARNE